MDVPPEYYDAAFDLGSDRGGDAASSSFVDHAEVEETVYQVTPSLLSDIEDRDPLLVPLSSPPH